MYCSTCGVAVAQGLSYCNYCGAKLNRSDSVSNSSEVNPETLTQLMVVVFVLGMIAIIVLMGVMKVVLGLPVAQVLALSLLPFLFMLILEGIFIRLLFRRPRGTETASETVLLRGQATKQLDAAQAPMLEEAKPSVTEHTTRAFDPLYTERK